MLMLDKTSGPTTPKLKNPALLRAGALVPLKENVDSR
jgi:hypothetical protein